MQKNRFGFGVRTPRAVQATDGPICMYQPTQAPGWRWASL